MYYLIYGFLYLVSLLPFFVLYGLSDFLSLVMYHLVRYRRKVVMGNLALAFPDKTEAERRKTARKFYRNLTDTFMESIKMISLGEKDFLKRCTADTDMVNRLAAEGKSIHLHAGHQMNWEYANWIFAKKLTIPWVGIYMKLASPAVDRLFYKIRSRFGTVLISTTQFKSRMHEVFKSNYALALAADQNPAVLNNAYWLYFFTKITPFMTGPDKGAVKNNAAVVFVKMVKTKRGHYHMTSELVTENAGSFEFGELTRRYRDFLESTIREDPSNYLWTHSRWKYIYNPSNRIFESNWVDTVESP